MGDSRSFRDAFGRPKAPARDGLGSSPDKFREKAAPSSRDAFKAAGEPAPQKGGDAFAPKAKAVKLLPGAGVKTARRAGLPPPPKPAAAKLGQPKPPKTVPAKEPKMVVGKMAAPLPAMAKQQKMTAPLSPKTVARPILNAAKEKLASPKSLAKAAPPVPKDPFGRRDTPPQLPKKALAPVATAGPTAPMTKPFVKAGPSAKSGLLPVSRPAKRHAAEPSPTKPPIAEPSPSAASKSTLNKPASEEPSATLDSSAVQADAKVDAARSPLQIVANESVLEHTGFKKFRRAARSSSLVLVSGAAVDAIASTDTLEADAAEDADASDVSTTTAAVDDPDTRVADKPSEPSVSPASPPPAAERAPAPADAGGPPPATSAKPPEPPAPVTPLDPVVPAPESIAASTAAAADVAPAAAEPAEVAAESPVEVVEPTVEPPSSVPFDTASEPVDQLASGPKPSGAGTPGAVETSWQEVAGDPTNQAQPTVAVLRKMETSPVAGYWGGATAGAKSALSKRGFNQDDIFGVVFGVAVLAFLLLWFVRGRGEESPAGDLLATPQSTTGQSLAALPSPAPAPKVDPFGDAPVNLKPTGPIPEGSPADPQIAAVAPPAATPAPAAPAPVIASPPSVAANPEAAIPVAERKMHAWFCTASSRMTKSSRTALKGQMAKFDDVFAGKELVVRGYADTRGSVELNADLGSRRAQTVADYLTARGLSVVDVQGVGELNGLGDNQNCSNQRRVDVWVKGGPAETPSRECTPEPDVEALVCG